MKLSDTGWNVSFLMNLMTDVFFLFKQTQPHNGKTINMNNISLFNIERETY